VTQRDGEERADKVLSRIEAFCRSLEEFADIGTRHDERFAGLRSVGIPGLKSAAVLFWVGDGRVVVLRWAISGRTSGLISNSEEYTTWAITTGGSAPG